MTNKEKLQSYVVEQKRPLIVYNIETTGCMDGSDNRITQVALAAYEYNIYKCQYELQDHMFMLAKPNEKSLQNIENRQKVTNENITILLQEEYVYAYTHEVKQDIKNCQNRQKTLDGKISKAIAKYGAYSSQVDNYKNRLKEEIALEEILTRELSEKEIYVKEHEEDILKSWECQEYVEEHFNRKKEELEEGPFLKEILSAQGIHLDTWREGDVGLSFGEIQIGINKFLKKYKKDDTIFLSNGTYFAKHYMDKEKLKLNKGEEIDIPKTFGQTDWTYSISTISRDYFNKTGKTMQHCDALTKALCMAEMIGKQSGIPFQNTSEMYLQEQAKYQAAKGRNGEYQEGDYVITMSQLQNAHIVMDIPRYNRDIPTFNSLEYIDFGSERRYVDLDRMFEVNDNFEVTLEGEKEPIKTWEELVEKIKALNGEISEELMNRIHEKYEEIAKTASEEKEEFEALKDDVYEKFLKDSNYDETLVEEPRKEKMSTTDEMLARLFAKNEQLENLQKEEKEIDKKVKQTEKILYEKKLEPIVKNMKDLNNLLKTFGMDSFMIYDGEDKFYYNVERNEVTVSNPYGNGAKDFSPKMQESFVKNVVSNWSVLYEKVLGELEKKLDNSIKSSKQQLSDGLKKLEELEEELEL